MDGIEFEYWDSCIFLAFLQKETHRPGEVQYVNDQVRKFGMGLVGITTSSIALTEVFEARLNNDQVDFFRDMYSRTNFHFVDASTPICHLASEIRSYYKINKVNVNGVGLYPSAPDAIHVASAITAQKQLKTPISLITFDSENKAKGNDLALTNLSGNIANKYPLIICRPPVKNQQINIDDVENTKP
ncbi:MAG: PIN domain-containing protein [Polaromonas sp.]|uniref:PIN domain-containing protein n=1 Tax=Polaromonas sp. TaxID=1869339 RepID=UPI001843A91D|nr:PIN domain-containing protein [Polaromonas sp.]MBA3592734.1 PIN domain-containing protein [Polaromonas sp.]